MNLETAKSETFGEQEYLCHLKRHFDVIKVLIF